MNTFKTFLTEEHEILLELQGYHKYMNKDFYEILRDLKDEYGHKWEAGSLGVVFVPKDKNYVYKCWVQDTGYTKFLDIVEKHQNNQFFPKVLSKRKKLDAFFKRPSDFKEDINIVKMEKLSALDDGFNDYIRDQMRMIKKVSDVEGDAITLKWLKNQISNESSAKRLLNKSIDLHAKGKLSPAEFNARYKEAMMELRHLVITKKKFEPLLEPMYEAMSLLFKAHYDSGIQYDMHSGNFMLRNKTELVITDPFVESNWESQVVMQNLSTGNTSATTVSGRKKTSSPK